MSIDPNTLNGVGTLASVAGLAATIAQWFQSGRSQRSTQKEQATIDDYLEWLRRKNHNELLTCIHDSKHVQIEIVALIGALGCQSSDANKAILGKLQAIDIELHTKFAEVSGEVALLRRDLQLFPSKACQTSDSITAFAHTYLAKVADQFNRLTILGVSEMRHLKQRLDLAYVSLHVKAHSSEDAEPQRAEEVLHQHARLIVRGHAGSGKSTLLSWIALQCAKSAPNANPWSGGIPFLIPLRRLADADGGRPNLANFVQYTLDPTLSAVTPPHNWIDTVLQHKYGVVLLDGVDELPAPLRPAFWDWLTEFSRAFPGNRIYVTSRPLPESVTVFQDRLWNPPPGFTVADLEDMNDADVRMFITNWHTAILTQTTDSVEVHELEVAGRALPEKLLEPANRRVRDLCRTPLLCALVCVLHWREEGYLPSQRIKLYDRCCAMLIEERDEKRRIALPSGPIRYLTLDDKEMILQQLALNMMRNKSGIYGHNQQIEISREEAISWIKPTLPNCQATEARKCDPDQLLNFLVERSGLLRHPAQGRIDFTHRTFQEYLAACAAGAENQAGALAERACDDQWHETIILAAGTKVGGIPFGNTLISELLSRGEAPSLSKQVRHTYLALAIACLETGRQIADKLRTRVINHLADILPPRDKNDARALSAAGDFLLPLLTHQKWKRKGARVLAACARTIALIGGTSATKMLLDPKGYGSEQRATILAEICECSGVRILEVPGIVALLQHDGPPPTVPKTIAKYIRDLSPLTRRHNLTSLSFDYCSGLSGIAPISQIKTLTRLRLFCCPQISDIEPLSHLPLLNDLDLTYCPSVIDIAPLAKLAMLRRLRLHLCQSITNFDSLAALTQLTYLDLDKTKISDLTPISALPAVQVLDLSNCQFLDNLQPLQSIPKLAKIYLRNCNRLTDFSPLLAFPALASLVVDSATRDRIPQPLVAKIRPF